MFKTNIDTHCSKLKRDQIQAVNTYRCRLEANQSNYEKFNDLIFEGWAADMLQLNGFRVTFRESPDLSIRHSAVQFFAEVKHFRTKEQDRIDQENMNRSRERLVTIGDTSATEGLPAWEQVVAVCKRKIPQYIEDVPNILIIGSSSGHCIDDAIMPTAINVLGECIQRGNNEGLMKLNGLMLLSFDYNISQKRSVYFFPIHTSHITFSQETLDALHAIRQWKAF